MCAASCDDDSRTPTTGLCEPTWRRVERALPVMRYSRGDKQASGNRFMCSPYSPESGVRTFTGSRSASVDATFSDHADDCTDNGFPRPQALRRLAQPCTALHSLAQPCTALHTLAQPHIPAHTLTPPLTPFTRLPPFTLTPLPAHLLPSPLPAHLLPSYQGYVMNLTAIANGEPPIADFLQYVNFSAMAEGLLGGGDGYPNLVFYFPLLPQNFSGFGASRYWTMVASPVPDMQGGRQQSVWFRFQQLRCAGVHLTPPCALVGVPQYYDTYWYSWGVKP